MSAHAIEWRSPRALWGSGDDGRPVIVNYDSDDFAPLLIADVSDRNALYARRAMPASHQIPLPGRAAKAPDTLKLFQPIHGEYALVLASLVCRVPGLPDRRLEPSREAVGFVLRRVEQTTQGVVEFAWVGADRVGQSGRWTRASAGMASPGEALHPLSRFGYVETAEDGRVCRRQVLGGLIPAASRDTVSVEPSWDPEQPRPEVSEFRVRILEARRSMCDARAEPDAAQREAAQLLLVDLMDLFRRYLPDVFEGIIDGSRPAGPGVWASLRQPAARAGILRPNLSVAEALADMWRQWTEQMPIPQMALELSGAHDEWWAGLDTQLTGALAAQSVSWPGEALVSARPSDATYVLRCVYSMQACGRRPGRHVVSRPSQPFRLAAYLDPDAPSRPVRIVVPDVLSPSALRRTVRNVGIEMGPKLRNRLDGLSLSGLLDGRRGRRRGRGFDLGEICSLSIPIVTICALIALMIFVNLLNFIFWWIPFLRVCLPLPRGRRT